MKPLSIVLLFLFTACFVADAFIADTQAVTLRFYTKGMLMPFLLCFFISEINTYITAGNRKYILYICCALMLSFAGDLLLLGRNALSFIAGIGFFLIAQVFYIIFFISIKKLHKRNLPVLFIIAAIVFCYVFLLNYLFWKEVKQQHLQLLVLVYSIVLGLMLFTSVNTLHANHITKANRFCFIAGAIFFVISDSMIGLNKFYLAKPLPGFYIMFTYCAAQFLLVYGAIKIITGNSEQQTNIAY